MSYCPSSSSSSLRLNLQFDSPIKSPYAHVQSSNFKPYRGQIDAGRGLYVPKTNHFLVNGGTERKRRRVSTTASSMHLSPWDDKPYQVLPGGEISYYDERDVVSFLNPPKQLIPLDPSSYNPAAYLWSYSLLRSRHCLIDFFNVCLISVSPCFYLRHQILLNNTVLYMFDHLPRHRGIEIKIWIRGGTSLS